MNHYVYQITNNINGKIYIGRRSCKCNPELDLKYMGSGKNIKAAIKKYGKENFTKTIIDICDSLETANDLEVLIVDESFIKRTDTYNLVIGGLNPIMYGRINPMFGKNHSVESKLKMSISGKDRIFCDETKKKMSQAQLNRFNTDDRINKNELIKTKLLLSDIDFTKFGWVGKAAIIINIAPQKVNNWMKRNMLDFYEINCFKRNNINALIR